MANLSPLQRHILRIIRRNPAAADEEHVLLASVWRIYGWDDTKSLEKNLERMPHAETISRRRRELYNLGLINYSSIALAKRTQAFNAERDRRSGWIGRLVRRLRV